MNVLLITNKELTGINYHRQIVPHRHLERTYEYKIDVCYDFNEVTDSELEQYQIVSFPRKISEDNTEEIVKRAKKYGANTIVDVDDYWVLHSTHPLRRRYIDKEGKYQSDLYAKPYIDAIKHCDWVTTTTELLAEKVRAYNSNVVVLPNSIDKEQTQYEVIDNPSDKVRIGWIGGVHHQSDLKLVGNGFEEIWKSNLNFQLCLGGWNYYDQSLQNKINYIDSNLATDIPKEIRSSYLGIRQSLSVGVDVDWRYIWNERYGNEYVWHTYEKAMTVNYKYIGEKYREYLFKQTRDNNEDWGKEKYVRLPALSPSGYCLMYNFLDVCLVPLEENNFNSFKSQLKIIEAGYFKKAVIVSDVNPYKIDCNKTNSIGIKPSKRNEGWGVAMKSLVINKDKREDLAESLHEVVKSKYMIDIVNKVRHEFYQSL